VDAGRILNSATVVEYRLGHGKVVVFGGRGCNYTPTPGFSLPHAAGEPFGLAPGDQLSMNNRVGLRERIRLVTLNTLAYLSTPNDVFLPAADAIAQDMDAIKEDQDRRTNTVLLPTTGWLFKTDTQQVGKKNGWYAPQFDTTGWLPFEVGKWWDTQGFPSYFGYAWYRLKLTAANRPQCKTLLHFGAVDEQATVYLDGKMIGHGYPGTSGWDKPFDIEITDMLTNEPHEHLLAVEVYNLAAAGGIWKPLSLLYR